MEDFKTLEVRRVQSSADLMQPGDYVFIPKREPIRRFQPIMNNPPRGFFRKLWWSLVGDPVKFKETVEILWPEYDAIIMNCPHCNAAIGTTKEHRIVSVEPLTIEKPLACAYSRGTESGALPTVAFHVQEGKIMPV